MPPVWEPRNNGPQNFGGQARPTELVISTPYTDAEVTVALTNGTPVATGTAVAGTPLIVSLTAFQGMTYAAFTAEGDKGLIITADEPVSVVYRNLSQRNQALASLKGQLRAGRRILGGHPNPGFQRESTEPTTYTLSRCWPPKTVPKSPLRLPPVLTLPPLRGWKIPSPLP